MNDEVNGGGRVSRRPLLFALIVGALALLAIVVTLTNRPEVEPAPAVVAIPENQDVLSGVDESLEQELSVEVEEPEPRNSAGIEIISAIPLIPDPESIAEEELRARLQAILLQEALESQERSRAARIAETTVWQRERPSGVDQATFEVADGPDVVAGVVPAGAIVRGELATAINSETGGTVVGVITERVVDETGTTVLIERGDRLIGDYRSAVSGQERALVSWRTMILGGDREIRLDPPWIAADRQGAVGLPAAVDTHMLESIGSAVVLGVAGAGAQLSQPIPTDGGIYDPRQIAAGEVGRQFSQIGAEYARRGLSRPPTLSVSSGEPFAVIVPQALEIAAGAR